MEICLAKMRPRHWPQVRAIYQKGIETGDATFETRVPSHEAWDQNHLAFCRLVALDPGAEIVGWAALAPVSSRKVYRGVAEVSVYVDPAFWARGVGSRLLEALVACSERHGIWTLQAGIFPENEASLRLHEKCGFRRVGIRCRLGKSGGVWRDKVLMERRSRVVGV